MGGRKRRKNDNSIGEQSKQFFNELGEREVSGINIFFYQCKICNVNINGNKLYNLASHLKHVHEDNYNKISDRNKETIQIKRLNLLQDLVEIIAVNGRPFSYILDSGFQSIIKKKVNKLNAAGCTLNLSDTNLPEVKKHLNEFANEARNVIKEQVKFRALSLIVDIVTKRGRSIFGVSIQYIFHGNLKVRSIGMIELLQSHTAKYLADMICCRLKTFEISLKQIVTITTDNGANVLKMVQEIDEILQDSITTQCDANSSIVQTATDIELSDLETDNEIANVIAELEELTDDEALERLFDQVLLDNHENLLNAMTNQITNDFGLEVLYDITGVNCTAHTLQLAVKDALKKLNHKHINVITLCRTIAKTLRMNSTECELKALGKIYRKPRLDIETRWCSVYTMVRYFFHLFFTRNL